MQCVRCAVCSDNRHGLTLESHTALSGGSTERLTVHHPHYVKIYTGHNTTKHTHIIYIIIHKYLDIHFCEVIQIFVSVSEYICFCE